MPLIKHISQNPWEDEDLSLRWNQEYQLELTDHKPLKSHQRAIGMPKISMWSWNKAAVTIIKIIIEILKKIYAYLYLLGGVKRYTPITSFTCNIPYFNSLVKRLLLSRIQITPKACISSATRCGISSARRAGYHQGAGKMHAGAWWDARAACRPWWYTPHFVRRWYAKPAAWINKKRTFVYQKFSFCLSKPQAWHIITARSVVHITKGALRPCISPRASVRLSCGLMIYNASHWWYTATSCGWYTRLRRDRAVNHVWLLAIHPNVCYNKLRKAVEIWKF